MGAGALGGRPEPYHGGWADRTEGRQPEERDMTATKEYVVICVEQDFAQEWSRHSSLQAAIAAAELYHRTNNRGPAAIDPFEITYRGRIVHSTRA